MYFPKGYTCLGEGGLLLKSFLCHLKGKNNQHRIIYKKELCGTYKISWIGKAAECYATPGEPPLPISWGKLLLPVPCGVSLLSSSAGLSSAGQRYARDSTEYTVCTRQPLHAAQNTYAMGSGSMASPVLRFTNPLTKRVSYSKQWGF